MDETETPKVPEIYTVRVGSAGEALVTAPNGRMKFMGPWEFLKFVIGTTWAACKARSEVRFEVQDDGR